MLKMLKAVCSITPNHAINIPAKFPFNTYLLPKSQLRSSFHKTQGILKLVSLTTICYWNT